MCHDIDSDPLDSVPAIKSPSSTVLASPSFLSSLDHCYGLRSFADGRQSCTSVQSMYVSCCASSPNDCWLIRCDVGQIEVLPDDVLLEIFDFCVARYQDLLRSRDRRHIIAYTSEISRFTVEWWQPLVHVCQRWRDLVFGSPRRLNLQLYYTLGSVTRKTPDVWPALPLLIMNDNISDKPEVMDGLTSALEHTNRICQINLHFRSLTSQIEKVWTAMQVPFPELTALSLYSPRSPSETVPVIPESFLGGSAPSLQILTFIRIPFPGLQKLLLSATRLVELHLWDIPHSAYISPEEMVTCLSVLTSLERLSLGLESPKSSPDQESGPYAPPLPTRSILPILTVLLFQGVNEYLEDLLARIDAPRLHRLWITFFNDIFFDTRELIQFIGRTLPFKPLNEAHVVFNSDGAWFQLQSQASNLEIVQVNILCREPNWQVSALAQICISFSPLLSAPESLYIYEKEDFYYFPSSNSKLDWKDDIENTEWLEVLFPFTAVKNLYLSKEFGPRIAPALQELTEGQMAAVLPTLQNIFLEGFQPSESVEEGIERFISGRQLTNHPITISSWDSKSFRSLFYDW
jgi:hypothetical protein